MSGVQTTWAAHDLTLGCLAVVKAQACDNCGKPIPDGEAWAGLTQDAEPTIVVFCGVTCRMDYLDGDSQ